MSINQLSWEVKEFKMDPTVGRPFKNWTVIEIVNGIAKKSIAVCPTLEDAEKIKSALDQTV